MHVCIFWYGFELTNKTFTCFVSTQVAFYRLFSLKIKVYLCLIPQAMALSFEVHA